MSLSKLLIYIFYLGADISMTFNIQHHKFHANPSESTVVFSLSASSCFILICFVFEDLIYLLLERGEGEGEKYQCMRDTSIGCLSHGPILGSLS